MISLSWGVATDVGRIRKTNQDSYLAEANVFAVADGMGGHVGGEVASKLALDVFSQAISSGGSELDVVNVAQDANSAILTRATKEPRLSGMGTTLCLLSVEESGGQSQLNLVNVGDSRGYLLRAGELFQLTDDHTLISEMVRSGELTTDEAVVHRARHILTRALGVEADLEVDHWKIDPKVGDVYLLCSDGLTNELTDPEIAQILSHDSLPEAIAQDLVDQALSAGGSDNVTCVVVRIDDVRSDHALSDGPRIVELPSQAKLRERLRSASHSVGGETVDREQFIVATNTQKNLEEIQKRESMLQDARTREDNAREKRVRDRAKAKASISTPATTGVPIRVNPIISSSGRTPELSSIPVPLPKRATQKRHRIGSIFRISVFILIVAVVIALGISAVGIYADHSYYVGLDGSSVTIYQGRPGGLLWYSPKLVKKTQVSKSQVAPYHIPELQKGVVEPSLAASLKYVNNLLNESSQISSSSSTVTTSTSGAGSAATSTTAVPGG